MHFNCPFVLYAFPFMCEIYKPIIGTSMAPTDMRFTISDIVNGVNDLLSGETYRQQKSMETMCKDLLKSVLKGKQHLQMFIGFKPDWCTDKYIRLENTHTQSEMLLIINKNTDNVSHVKTTNFLLDAQLRRALGITHAHPVYEWYVPKDQIEKVVNFFKRHGRCDVVQGILSDGKEYIIDFDFT